MENKAKLIFVDFDDTLCVHTQYLNDRIRKYIFYNPEEGMKKIYGDSMPNYLLIDALAHYKMGAPEGEVKIIMLTATNSKLLAMKQCWCEQNCPSLIDEFIATSTDMTKTELIQAYCNSCHLNTNQILFIDDNWSDRKPALQADIPCVTPQEVMLVVTSDDNN